MTCTLRVNASKNLRNWHRVKIQRMNFFTKVCNQSVFDSILGPVPLKNRGVIKGKEMVELENSFLRLEIKEEQKMDVFSFGL